MDIEKLVEEGARALWKASALNIGGVRDLDAEWGAMSSGDRDPYIIGSTVAPSPPHLEARQMSDDTSQLWRRMLGARRGVKLQQKFWFGQRVRKKSGSQWQGRVVGFYSTTLTPIGYAVESEREPGSVQIYPESALEAMGEDDDNKPHEVTLQPGWLARDMAAAAARMHPDGLALYDELRDRARATLESRDD